MGITAAVTGIKVNFLRTTRTSCSGLALTCHRLMHMTIPNFASGTRVQTGLLLGSSKILICRKKASESFRFFFF